MSKGNIFMGVASGKLGDVVLYRRGGQQISRVRVREISNPQTRAQLVNRVIVSTLAKAYSILAPICDHSFEGFQTPAENMRRFMSLNQTKIREGIANVINYDPDLTSLGNFSKKTDFSATPNTLIVSRGSVATPFLTLDVDDDNFMKIVLLADPSNMSYADVVTALGLKKGDQLTFLYAIGSPSAPSFVDIRFARVILAPASGDMSLPFLTQSNTINDPNSRNEGSVSLVPVVGGDVASGLSVRMGDVLPGTNMVGFTTIVSRYENKEWKRSDAVLNTATSAIASMSNAIESWISSATSSKYLNAGNAPAESSAEGSFWDNFVAIRYNGSNLIASVDGSKQYRPLTFNASASATFEAEVSELGDVGLLKAKRGNTAIPPTVAGNVASWNIAENGNYKFYYGDKFIGGVNFTLGE